MPRVELLKVNTNTHSTECCFASGESFATRKDTTGDFEKPVCKIEILDRLFAARCGNQNMTAPVPRETQILWSICRLPFIYTFVIRLFVVKEYHPEPPSRL